MTTGLSADSTIANIYLAQDFDQHVCKSRSLACKGFMRFVDGGAIIKSSFLEIMTLFDFGEARWSLHWFFVQDVVFSWLSMLPHGGYLRRETEFILLVSLSTAVFFLCCVFYFSKYCFFGPSARWIITNKKTQEDGYVKTWNWETNGWSRWSSPTAVEQRQINMSPRKLGVITTEHTQHSRWKQRRCAKPTAVGDNTRLSVRMLGFWDIRCAFIINYRL